MQKTYKTIRGLLSKRERWIKGREYNDDRTRFCLLGAVDQVYGRCDSQEKEAVMTKLIDTICEMFPKTTGAKEKSVVAFNDAKHRTFYDIKRLLDRARV